MSSIPTSMIAAIATSAAAGKNPWLPLGLIFVLAAPESVPSVLMEAELHQQLHAIGPAGVLWTLGLVFVSLSILDSLADKVGFIEKWLVPVSTAWRPFAGIACAAIVGYAAARDVAVPSELEAMRVALVETHHADLLVGGGIVALTIGLAAVFNWIATMSKTGVRLLMTMVPVPGLKLAHSFVDDFFAIGASIAGLAFADSALVPFLLAIYLGVGLFTGPLLTRLTWIHFRIGWSLILKANDSLEEGNARPAAPGWALRWLEREGLTGAPVLRGYVYRAPGLGWCRAGHLVLAPSETIFLTRVWWRARALRIGAHPAEAPPGEGVGARDEGLVRVGLADTATNRVVTLVERLTSGALREVHVYLFPAVESAVLPLIEAGAAQAELVHVRADSPSARAVLPGFADRERSVRFLPEERAGSLRLQGLLTIASAIGFGLLTGGVFIPIGTGYLASPFKTRFLVGWLISGYLALCVLGTMGLGWPAAVLYASVLNVLTLRDQTRNALKARVDGFVDKRAWLPMVANRVWVSSRGLKSPSDRCEEGDAAPLTDGTWRAVVRLLADAAEESPPTDSSADPSSGAQSV